MILSTRFFRSFIFVALLALALLPMACGSKPAQEDGEPSASSEPAAQPHANGLPPEQFFAEFGAMGYTTVIPWMDGGSNAWGASAHKQYDGNQINLMLSSNTQSRVDQIALTAIVADGTMNPQMRETFETSVRTCFAGMELKIPDAVVEAVRNETAYTGEAGRFSVHLTRNDGGNGGYMLAFSMNSQ